MQLVLIESSVSKQLGKIITDNNERETGRQKENRRRSHWSSRDVLVCLVLDLQGGGCGALPCCWFFTGSCSCVRETVILLIC